MTAITTCPTGPASTDTPAVSRHLARLALDIYTGRTSDSDGVSATLALLRLPTDVLGEQRRLVLDDLLSKLHGALSDPDLPACVGAANGELARSVRYYVCDCHASARDISRVVRYGRRGSRHDHQEFLGDATHWLPIVAMALAAMLMHTAGPYEAIDLL